MGTDSLYYIMDYSGNYYRTNQADQLVSVVSQQDAMVFTFAQANSRICVGKKAAFYEYLAAAGIAHTICVATEYGELVLKEHPLVTVHRGRMDEEAMREYLKQKAFAAVVDATSPPD